MIRLLHPPTLRLMAWNGLNQRQLGELAEIYRESFDVPWEMPVAHLLEGPESWACQFPHRQAIAAVADQKVLGCAVIKYLVTGQLLYLEYLAVSEGQRDRGIGGVLFAALAGVGDELAASLGRPAPRALVWEVELVGALPLTADHDQRRRRYTFYQRHGGRRLGVFEPRPPHAPQEMPDWELMFLPLTGWPAAISRELRQDVACSVMVEGYGRSADEPWIAPFLAGIS